MQHRPKQSRRPSHATVVAYLALFVALGGSAFAAATIGSNDIKRAAVKSKHVKKDAIKQKHLRDNSVGTEQVINDDLTGDDVLESSLGLVPNADTVDGRHASSFVSTTTYRAESTISAGTLLGDGTHFQDQSCNAGDELLSGGPANISDDTDLLESFPINTTTWRARINKNGAGDNFSVVVLCADQ